MGSDRRHELEAQIAALEEDSRRLSEERADVQRRINERASEHQADTIERLDVEQARLQAELNGLPAQRDVRSKEIDARVGALQAELQRHDRDERRPLPAQELDSEERERRREQVSDALAEAEASRAEIDADFARRTADLQNDLNAIGIRRAETTAELNRANREDNEFVQRLTEQIDAINRKLQSVRQELNTVIAEQGASEAQQVRELEAAARASEMEQRLAELSQERENLASQLEELAPLVEAQREATSAVGAQELSEFYTASANSHKGSWKTWLKWLIASVALAAIVGPLTILLVHPDDDAGAGEIFTSSAIAILVIGLLLYLVRITSLQFRVHRHLEAVDRGKAAALSTYNRIVAGPSTPELRSAVLAALAEAVFKLDDTGFIDASSDHVTLIERVVAPAVQRFSGGQ